VKAAVFYEYGPAEAMQYADIPDPGGGPGDVLIRVQACGVNHSDLDSRAGTSRWTFELPMVLGAEFTGTVVEAGSQAGHIRTGSLVTALQQFNCGYCAQCAMWRPDLCEDFEIFGTTRWGGYGELVRVPARVVVPLDPDDDPLVMAAGQCVVSTAWHMVNRLALVRPGDLRYGWRIVGFRLAPPDDLAASLELIRRGTIKVPIAATFPVSDAAEAHRFLERREHVGKVLLVAE
jgi:NADPH:quinone reductase-like Zn-dependent oxidoreductase